MKYKETLWEKITLPFHRFAFKVKSRYWNFKYRCQRFVKGYSDEDVFEFAYNFIPHIEGVLKEFIKIHHGYPDGYTSEEYDRKLNEMLEHLQWMDEDRVDAEAETKFEKYSIEYFEESEYLLEYHTEKFFELFKELFWSLWD